MSLPCIAVAEKRLALFRHGPNLARLGSLRLLMKTFFTIFLAILASAAVIYGIKSRLDEWHKAIDKFVNEIDSTHKVILEISRSSKGGSLKVLEEGIDAISEAEERGDEARRVLVELLEHKPFGLSLTDSEQGELNSAKSIL